MLEARYDDFGTEKKGNAMNAMKKRISLLLVIVAIFCVLPFVSYAAKKPPAKAAISAAEVKLNLKWDKVKGATKYEVAYKTGKKWVTETVKRPEISLPSDTKKIQVKIRAYNGTWGEYSDILTIKGGFMTALMCTSEPVTKKFSEKIELPSIKDCFKDLLGKA